MKHLAITALAIACSFAFGGCTHHHHSKSISDVAEQLTEQFRHEHDSKSQPLPARKLKSVQITSFSYPPGNVHPYLGIGVQWEGSDMVTYTGVPLVPLGDGIFGVTYTDSTTKEELSAVISFR